MSKNAVIFGASSGIGRELARLLVNDGYKVIITGRRVELLKEIQKENPENYIIKQHDINNVDKTLELFELLSNSFDDVDLIIHNAGIAEENFDLEWDKDLPTINTNVIAATRVYQLAYNYFKEQGFGHLVGISSVASIRGNRHVPAYHASKAYQSSYLESLWMKAARTKKAEISITNILPGYVKTDIIIGDTFWMSTVEKATGQIFKAIKNKKRKAYVTKRWRIIAVILKILPARTLIKYF
jgi:short-subunit dehydrogenase|tara:strand:- start:4761 stop:5483 length:723 start_codon:yes stop_codon:yes gene_type:complete